MEELIAGVRYSIRSQVVGVIERCPAVVNSLDLQGNTSAHWAAKKGDLEILHLLAENGADLTLPTSADAKMMPIHWAASDGKIAAIRLLLQRGVDINAQDGNGCTPVIIAAQHDQATAVAYLVRNGADMALCDANGDTALHWAAYKGLVEVVGLLTHCCPQALSSDDAFGQTPLHLAALRGHEEVVEYLVSDCGADTSRLDKNGVSALDLSLKKGQLKCEWVLRRLTAKSFLDILRGYGSQRLRDPRILGMIVFGISEQEWGKWPWRIVFFSNLVGSLVSFDLAMSPALSDLSILHLFNTIFQCGFWLCFAMCLQKNSAIVRREECGNAAYESALNQIGNFDSVSMDLPSVCHTCHVRRPLRSKHCKFQRRCVHKFDHFCPFVYNTVSRDNYKYFFFLLLCHFCGSVCWMVTIGYLVRRVVISWSLTAFILYHLMWFMMILGLLQYHVALASQNLTTNEHLGMQKYAYLRNELGSLDNPFSKGSVWDNFFDILNPSSKPFYSRREVLADKYAVGEKADPSKQKLMAENV